MEYRDLLGDTLYELGNALYAVGDLGNADLAFARSQAVRQQLLEDFGEDPLNPFKLGNPLLKRSQIAMDLGTADVAYDWLVQAMEIYARELERLAEINAEGTESIRDALANVSQVATRALYRLELWDDALATNSRRLEIATGSAADGLRAVRARTLARLERTAEALAVIEDIESPNELAPRQRLDVAMAYAWVARHDADNGDWLQSKANVLLEQLAAESPQILERDQEANQFSW